MKKSIIGAITISILSVIVFFIPQIMRGDINYALLVTIFLVCTLLFSIIFYSREKVEENILYKPTGKFTPARLAIISTMVILFFRKYICSLTENSFPLYILSAIIAILFGFLIIKCIKMKYKWMLINTIAYFIAVESLLWLFICL